MTLRLASDFLVDYLWRRYWGPQAEHLGFVWGAFDQLISRYGWVRGWVGGVMDALFFVSVGVVLLFLAFGFAAKGSPWQLFFVENNT